MEKVQSELDQNLDRRHTIQVKIASQSPLPKNNPAYEPLIKLQKTGFEFTPRQLLHAIGCKTANYPASKFDECLKAALLYTNIMDL